MGKRAVVDASALGALLFGESKGSRVAGSLEQTEILAPSLLRYEIGSICIKKSARHPERREQLSAALGYFERMGIREAPVPLEEMVKTAERERLSIYDAAYLWLARATGSALVTLDGKLARAMRRSRGVSEPTRS